MSSQYSIAKHKALVRCFRQYRPNRRYSACVWRWRPMNIHRLNSRDANFETDLTALLALENSQAASIDGVVEDVIARVRQEGDAALLDFTQRFDR